MNTAMVWGAYGGIGRAMVEELLAQSWQVLAVTRNAERLRGLSAVAIEADVAIPASVEQAVLIASQEVSQVDLWIYAVGDILSSSVAVMKPEEFRRILDANLTGAFLSLHSSIPLLADQSHIVLVGAQSERLRLPGLSAYAAAKVGLEAFAESFAKEERKRRVTVVRPSSVDTLLWKKVTLKLPPNAMPPQGVAKAILEAYQSGHRGILDL